ncbi:MAG: serine/threonine protein kinase [Deltaproteobacteria bacterium]|nr:serine/threonine protein kinase [Deltaproteobacteria bacterium]MBW2120919.1 serine/threonine protein kinase [Deltaproteobacteria bacterium]
MAEKSNYKLKKKIGSGGMSTVYLAHDTRLDREVAVKVLRIDPRLGLEQDARREVILRFQQEAKAAARLNHPNIVAIYQVGRQGEQYYIVMEYLDGVSLGSLMKPGQGQGAERVVQWITQVCDGLDFAHQRGVIHRDIKPDNLILLKNGTVKITDFGIARLEKSEMVRTKDETFMGTIHYCSPEQLREFRSIDRRTDIYSTGVVCYQLLTGRLPFYGGSIAETIDRILKVEPEPPGRIVPGIPVKLERVVLRCLAKNPADRFQTAGELREALSESIVPEAEGAWREVRGAAVSKSRTWKPVFFRLSMTIGLILMLATFLFGYFVIESKRGILQREASIRGRHIAYLLSLLSNDAAIGRDPSLLGRYVEEIGRDAHLVFVELMRGNQVVAGYHAEHVTPEEDVLMISYPLAVDKPEEEGLKIGFSKAAMNRQIRKIKVSVGLALGGILAFLVGVSIAKRFRFAERA